MALLGNGYRFSMNPMNWLGGVSTYAIDAAHRRCDGNQKNWFYGQGTSSGGVSKCNKSGRPDGVTHPYAFVMPIKPGGMASRNVIAGSGTMTAELYLGKDLSAGLTGTGSIDSANLALSTGLSAALTGTGTISSAAMVGTVQCTANLTGTGTISSAPLSMIAGLTSSLAGTCSMTANLTGLAELSADITPFTELSPQSLSAAVFATMINSLTFEEFLKVQEAFMFGKSDGFISGGGTVHFRDAADTKNVITGVMDANKNRTSVTVNP